MWNNKCLKESVLNSGFKFLLSGFLLWFGQLAIAMPAQAGNFEKIQEKGVISIAVYRDYLPFSYKKKGRITGIDVDMAKSIAERLGYSVNIVPFTADETMDDDLRNMVWKGHYLGVGPADIMMHVPVDKILAENNDRVNILAPYFNDQISLLYDKQQLPLVADLNVFRKHKVGVELDSLSDHYMTSVYGGAFRANVVHFFTAEEAVKALKEGKISAVMGPQSHLEGGLRYVVNSVSKSSGKDGNADNSYVLTRPFLNGVAVSGWDVGVAVKAGEDELVKLVNKTLDAMRKDGTVKKIFEKHGLTYRKPTKS